MIYKRIEGEVVRNGFNWDRNKYSTLELIFRLGKFSIYFRIRSPEIVKNKSIKKYLFSVEWYKPTRIGRLEYRFETQTVCYNEYEVALEVLEDFIESKGIIWPRIGKV